MLNVTTPHGLKPDGFWGGIPSALCSPTAVDDVDGCICVPVEGRAAHRTQMPPLGQFLFRPVPTSRTVLARVRRVYRVYLSVGTRSLTRETLAEL